MGAKARMAVVVYLGKIAQLRGMSPEGRKKRTVCLGAGSYTYCGDAARIV